MPCFPTVLIPFREVFAPAVEAALDRLGNPAGPPLKRALDRLALVHFMSLSVIRDAGPGQAVLVLEACADGDPSGALDAIAGAVGPSLTAVLEAAELAVAPSLSAFLIAHNVSIGPTWSSQRLGLCFAGTPGLTVTRIRQEAALAWRVTRLSRALSADRGALATLDAVRAILWRDRAAKWAFNAEPIPWIDAPPKRRHVERDLAVLAGGVLLLLAGLWRGLGPWAPAGLVLAALAALAATLFALRRAERRDQPIDTLDARHVAEVMRRENACAQNLLVTVSEMKPGRLRRGALRLAFLVIGQLAAKEYKPGFLSDLGTIHAARWLLLPGARRLVFFSNYDGSLESYLEDFIQKASEGVTAIWSNTVGFPRSRWLFLDGARDGDRLRRCVQRIQIPVRFWYSAYPRLTTTRIRANALIRRGIASVHTEEEAQEWLACFGGERPLPEARQPSPWRPHWLAISAVQRLAGDDPGATRASLEKDKIPTLVFSKHKRLRYGACLVIRLADRQEAGRAALKRLAKLVTFGPNEQADRAVTLGLAATGLRKLGLPPAAFDTFSPAFLNGMAAPARARALGDVGRDAPERWEWGGPANASDAILLAYHLSPGGLPDLLNECRACLGEGGTVIHQINLTRQPGKGHAPVEPFGFTDGVSQPAIRGVNHDRAWDPYNSILEPGEFVLGYRDESGFLPPTPTIDALHDPRHALPALDGDPQRRDLGRNGTYLAVRQLEQHVAAFKGAVTRAAQQLRNDQPGYQALPLDAVGTAVATKLVGRWPNGSSVALHPAVPGAHRRNDFWYGTADPNGLACPFGAHTRRANPRDSLAPGSRLQVRITDRHRLLRVGRSYDPQQPDEEGGLLFMALNAELGRQFEFVQQTWLLGRSFHGLEDEGDPLLGRGCPGRRRFTIQTAHGPIRLTLPERFVTVKGGGYFFVPGRDALRFLAG